jgi:septum formation protein
VYGRVVLASASPRRADLLRCAGVDIEVRPADIDESIHEGEAPEGYVARLSVEKAHAVAQPGEIVIAADTTVVIDGAILGKPTDADDARRMMELLSGTTHLVHTGVTVVRSGSAATVVVTTAVTFVELDEPMIDWYVATGEPFDKAGGYALQGAGAALVGRVDGSVSNVIGLPLVETLALLR